LLRGRLTGGDAAAILAWAELSEAVRWWKWVVVRWNGAEEGGSNEKVVVNVEGTIR
jgi:hypothetical protein